MAATTQPLEVQLETNSAAQKAAQKKGDRMIARALSRFFGLAFLFSAIGMWLAPGANWDGDLALMKLGVTFFFGIVGMTFVLCADRPDLPDLK